MNEFNALLETIERERDTFSSDATVLSSEIVRLRKRDIHLRNLNAALMGAASSVLDAIHRSGGWSAQPPHLDRIHEALRALEGAVMVNLNEFEALHDEAMQCR